MRSNFAGMYYFQLIVKKNKVETAQQDFSMALSGIVNFVWKSYLQYLLNEEMNHQKVTIYQRNIIEIIYLNQRCAACMTNQSNV